MYSVSATVIDDDMGTGGGTTTILVKNVNPSAQITSIESLRAIAR
jgi:precorrin-6B methylase 2